MADSTTPNYGWTLPTFGLDRDVWGDLLNDNWSTLDGQLKTVADAATAASGGLAALAANIVALIEPVGSIKPWPVPTAPSGWLPCDGFAVSRVDFADLFAVIGTTWGAGNGSTTFAIPNFVGRTLVHRDNGSVFVGTQFGENQHTLNVAEMPVHAHGASSDAQGQHNHTYQQAFVTAGVNAAFGTQVTISSATAGTSNDGLHAHNITVGANGGGGAHNNIQASTGVLWIIKAVKLPLI